MDISAKKSIGLIAKNDEKISGYLYILRLGDKNPKGIKTVLKKSRNSTPALTSLTPGGGGGGIPNKSDGSIKGSIVWLTPCPPIRLSHLPAAKLADYTLTVPHTLATTVVSRSPGEAWDCNMAPTEAVVVLKVLSSEF